MPCLHYCCFSIACRSVTSFGFQNLRRSCIDSVKINYIQKCWKTNSNFAPDERVYELGNFADDIQPYLSKKRKRELSEVHKIDRGNETPIIKCKHSNLNHYGNQTYSKFDPLPLASKGWKNYKSKGDYFTIEIHNKDFIPEEKDLGTFRDIKKLNSKIIDILENKGINAPSEIQKLGIDAILSRRHTILAAETGCGKTLAYLAPLVHQIVECKETTTVDFNSPLALIITPGRELAEQISEIVKWFKELSVTSKLVLGGNTRDSILNPSFTEADVIITTIGIISKLTNIGIYSLKNVRHVVLDEADTLLDDSFSSCLVNLLDKMTFQSLPGAIVDQPSAQLTMVSATMPTDVPEILDRIINVDKLIRVTTSKLHRVMSNVKQHFMRCGRSQKPGELLRLMQIEVQKKRRVMIFCNKTKTAHFVSIFLGNNNINSACLTGELNYKARNGLFKQFQDGKIQILVCTGVASRGLDTKTVEHVINYDFPQFSADYLHRCGRTGRLGSNVKALVTNLVSGANEIDLVNKIETSVRLRHALKDVDGNIKKMLEQKSKEYEKAK